MATERSKTSSSEHRRAADRHVVFWVAKRCMALPIDAVREVVDLQRVCPVPMAPPAVLGIVSLRGTIMSVLDAEQVLLASAMAVSSAKVLVLVREGAVVGGLAVQRVQGVMALPQSDFLRSHVATSSPMVLGYHDLQLGELVAVIDTDALFQHIASQRFDGATRFAQPLS
jgi:chemotaxis signal transduction protein